MIKEQSEQLGRKLNNWELSDLFEAFEMDPASKEYWTPKNCTIDDSTEALVITPKDDVLYTNTFTQESDCNSSEWSNGYEAKRGEWLFVNGAYRNEQEYHGIIG